MNLFKKNIEIKQDNNVILIKLNKKISKKEFSLKISSLVRGNNIRNFIDDCVIVDDKGMIVSVDIKILFLKDKTISISNNDLNYKLITRDNNGVIIFSINENGYEIETNETIYSSSEKDIERKKEMINLIENLQKELKQIPNVSSFINMDNIYYLTNTIKEKRYKPIISDDVITLSSKSYRPKKTNCDFDIILNETGENIGSISFEFETPPDYNIGNVNYVIEENYRNNGYATRALHLLKKVLIKSAYTGDKTLYIKTLNEYSEKVATNCGAVYSDEDNLYKIEIK